MPDNDGSHGEILTYFYVFVDDLIDSEWNTSRSKSASSSSDKGVIRSLDATVRTAFKRFAREFKNEAHVDINPKNYHPIRKAFGIQQLPAFGVSDLDLTSQFSLPSDPPKLPAWWNPFGRKERARILASEKFLPKVERAVVSQNPNADDLYHFVRDLHITNIDEGLFGVVQKIEREVRAMGGKKLLDAVSIAKKVVVGL